MCACMSRAPPRPKKKKSPILFSLNLSHENSFYVKSCCLWKKLSTKMCSNQNIITFKFFFKICYLSATKNRKNCYLYLIFLYDYFDFFIHGFCVWGQTLPYAHQLTHILCNFIYSRHYIHTYFIYLLSGSIWIFWCRVINHLSHICVTCRA